MLCNFIEITLSYGCSPVNLPHIFRSPFPKNTSGRLLLTFPGNLLHAVLDSCSPVEYILDYIRFFKDELTRNKKILFKIVWNPSKTIRILSLKLTVSHISLGFLFIFYLLWPVAPKNLKVQINQSTATISSVFRKFRKFLYHFIIFFSRFYQRNCKTSLSKTK